MGFVSCVSLTATLTGFDRGRKIQTEDLAFGGKSIKGRVKQMGGEWEGVERCEVVTLEGRWERICVLRRRKDVGFRWRSWVVVVA